MRMLWHWMRHMVGMNTGTIEVWWDSDRLMVGFQCAGCGDISGIHEAPPRQPLPETVEE